MTTSRGQRGPSTSAGLCKLPQTSPPAPQPPWGARGRGTRITGLCKLSQTSPPAPQPPWGARRRRTRITGLCNLPPSAVRDPGALRALTEPAAVLIRPGALRPAEPQERLMPKSLSLQPPSESLATCAQGPARKRCLPGGTGSVAGSFMTSMGTTSTIGLKVFLLNFVSF